MPLAICTLLPQAWCSYQNRNFQGQLTLSHYENRHCLGFRQRQHQQRLMFNVDIDAVLQALNPSYSYELTLYSFDTISYPQEAVVHLLYERVDLVI